MAESAHYDIDSTPVRAHVSSSGRRPPHAVRSAGVAYLPICGFQEFHPVGRVSSCGWVALCERRRVGFARLSGWQPVGNWAASAGEFSSIPVTRRRYPDNEQKNRDARFASKNGQKPNRGDGRRTRLQLAGRAETISAVGQFFLPRRCSPRERTHALQQMPGTARLGMRAPPLTRNAEITASTK